MKGKIFGRSTNRERNWNLLPVCILLALVAVSVSCPAQTNAPNPPTPVPQTNVEKLRKYETANPTNDFAADLKNNDIHFMAVRGYSVIVPGLNDSKPKLPRKI